MPHFKTQAQFKGPVYNSQEREEYDKLVSKHNLLNYFSLKKDTSYSIEKMAEILDILHSRHKGDKYWYARYHSSTVEFKQPYAGKVLKNIKHMDKVNKKYLEEQILAIKDDLNKFASVHEIDKEKIQRLNSSLNKFILDKTSYIAKN